jgi:hypothetical protein
VALSFELWVENLSTSFRIRGSGSSFSICKVVSIGGGGGDSKPGTVCEEL